MLRRGGKLLISFHGGQGEVHTDNWFGEPVSVSANLFGADEIAHRLGSARFNVDEIISRPPYEFEYQTERVYVSATK